MKNIKARALLLTVFVLLGACASSPPVAVQQPAASYAELDATLAALPAGRSLLVLDLDNTVLTMDDALGGVAWYDWQQLLEQSDEREPGEIDNELAVQGILYATRDMSLTEPGLDERIASLRAAGVDVIALTARGPQYRDSTLEQLTRNGVEFSLSPECGPPLCNRRGTIDADHVEAVAEAAFGREALIEHAFKSGRPLSMSQGVAMVAGQNKGIVLALLLRSWSQSYDQIVFVDDAAKNIEQMTAFAPFIGSNLTIVHYTRFEEAVRRFLESSEEQRIVIEQWQRMRDALCIGEKPDWCESL